MKRIAQEPAPVIEPARVEPSVAPLANASAPVAVHQASFPSAAVFGFVFVLLAAAIGTASRVLARNSR
jgi:hypothetical protein